ncbi:GPW/gp25 family protein [Lactococcus petauri]
MATTKVKIGEEFLGIGLYGPLRIGSSGEFDTKAGKEIVAESIKAILSTTSRFKSQGFFISGQRFMRDDFGCPQKILKHENLDDNLIALAESIYIEAIEKWEPRVVITGIRSQINEFQQSISTLIETLLKDTNETLNVVVIRDTKGQLNFKVLQAA